MQMEIFFKGRDTKGTSGFPGRQGIFLRFPAPPVASCPGQTRPLGSDSVRAIWRYAQKTPENPQCLPGKPLVPSAVPRSFKRSRKRKRPAPFMEVRRTLSRTGFTASAVNPFSSGNPRKMSLNCSGGTKQEVVGRWGGTSARLSDFFRVSCLEGGTV